jgi:hypothetical protein
MHFIARKQVCTYKTTNSRPRGSTVNRRVVCSDIGRSSVPVFNVRKKLCSRDNSRAGSILINGPRYQMKVVIEEVQSDKRDKQPNIYIGNGQAVCVDDLVDIRHRSAKRD